VGDDGVSALPPLSFSYDSPVLTSASNGLGGSVSFDYEQVGTLFWSCVGEDGEGLCNRWAPTATETSFGSDLLGLVLKENLPGTIPIYWSCVGEDGDSGACNSWAVTTTETTYGSDLLGYIYTTNPLWTIPLYLSCTREDGDSGNCNDWALATTPGHLDNILLGYIYTGRLDGERRRVTSRTLSDGLGWSSTTSFSYRNAGVGGPDNEFRGLAQVRTIDPFGNYTDTWFYQDDLKKGRAYQVEVRSNTGALYNKTVNTFTTSNPYPGVTFVALTRTDAYECEGQPTCHQHAQTFAYDTNGNPIQTTSLGDVSVIPLKMGRPLPKAGVFAHGQAEVVANNIAAAWTGRGAARRFDGKGMCFIETGGARAGMGSGNFYAEPLPDVRLYQPGLLWHGAKVLYEKYWLWRRF